MQTQQERGTCIHKKLSLVRHTTRERGDQNSYAREEFVADEVQTRSLSREKSGAGLVSVTHKDRSNRGEIIAKTKPYCIDWRETQGSQPHLFPDSDILSATMKYQCGGDFISARIRDGKTLLIVILIVIERFTKNINDNDSTIME